VTNNFMAGGGDGFTAFEKGTIQTIGTDIAALATAEDALTAGRRDPWADYARSVRRRAACPLGALRTGA
jgi:hypothetical protein